MTDRAELLRGVKSLRQHLNSEGYEYNTGRANALFVLDNVAAFIEAQPEATRDAALEEAAVNSWQTLQYIIVKQNLGAGAYDYAFDVVMNIRALKSTPPQPEAKPAECEHVWVPQISADKVRCDKCGASYLAQHPWPADKDQWTAYAKPAQEAPTLKKWVIDRFGFGPGVMPAKDDPVYAHDLLMFAAELDRRLSERK